MTRILYVEDNEDNVYMLSQRLKRQGFEIAIAGNGLEAIEMCRALRPDLILMDLSLPVLDGWETARRLKSAAETRAVPIIALSAHAMTEDRERAIAAGCDDYDTKPVDLPRLLQKIRSLLPKAAGDG